MSQDLFGPQSIAVLGASEDKGRFGGRVMSNLIDCQYQGTIYPINPKYESVFGRRCYSTLDELPYDVDAAIIAIPAHLVVPAIEECGRKKVGLAVVMTSGFAEIGPEGAQLQEVMVETAKRAGVRVLGPNGLGFFNVAEGIAATPNGVLPSERLIPGHVSLVSQSGAFAFSSVFSRAYDHGVVLRFVVASGNEADVTTADVITYFVADPGTACIAAMVEGIADPVRFCNALAAANVAAKSVVILKVGRSKEGRDAAAAHTAAMAGSDVVNDAVFQRYGVVRVDDLDELWEVSTLLATTPLPKGRRVALVSSSGGLGGLFADQVRGQGLELATLSDRTLAELAKVLPPYIVPGNPVDITGVFVGGPDEPMAFKRFIELLTNDPGVDILVVGQVVVGEQVGAAVVEAVKAAPITSVVLSIGGARAAHGLRSSAGRGVHIFEQPLACAKTLRRLCERAEWLSRQRGTPEPPRYVMNGRLIPQGIVDAHEALDLLTDYRLPLPQQKIVDNLEDAVRVAEAIGFPVVAKAIVSGSLHKTETGGVELDLRDDAAVRAAVRRLFSKSSAPRILIQQMVPAGIEMIVGIQHDPQFGPAILVGAGGTLVELLDDKLVAVPPFAREELEWRIRQLKVHRLLTGVRGSGPADLDAFVDLIMTVAKLALENGSAIESLDLNPVVVLPQGQGCVVVDWKLVGRKLNSSAGRSA